ncbi:hypothetical protein U9O_01937, partial [Enterococcus faecalis EnGen0233]
MLFRMVPKQKAKKRFIIARFRVMLFRMV